MSSISTDSNEDPEHGSDHSEGRESVHDAAYTRNGQEASSEDLATWEDFSNVDEAVNDSTSRHKRSNVTLDERWKRLRGYYRDEYYALFKENTLACDDGVPTVEFPESQIGVVTWQPEEKTKFFHALSRNGRLAIPQIAESVGSKSQLEVLEYLSLLRQWEAERHLYEKQTKSISHADIPAASEVSAECESALEKAADALAVFQDRYDQALGVKNNPNTWLIDREAAKAFDVQTDENEENYAEDRAALHAESRAAHSLFRLSTWIELTERVFMNSGAPRLHENWTNTAFEAEKPAITRAALLDFYNLVVSLLRRTIQTSMFLAMSRIRASKTSSYKPRALVKEQDVIAALDVLKMQRSPWEYWIKVARRNNLQIISGAHGRGQHGKQAISYDDAEKALSERIVRGRGRPSVSLNKVDRSSSARSSPTESEYQEDDIIASDWNDIPESIEGPTMEFAREDAETDDSETSDSDIEEMEDESIGEDGYGGISTSKQQRQRIHLEYQQDAYMEALDDYRSREEERGLWQVLGQESNKKIKTQSNPSLRNRPKNLRKTMDDLRDWQGTFQAEWETFGVVLPEEDFYETERQRKKRKINPRSDQGDEIDTDTSVHTAQAISIRGGRP